MITINGLSKCYGSQILFQDANLQLNKGAVYGIVGANGSGKSTLLRIIQGIESADEGEVLFQRHARLGVLKQDHFAYETTPIVEVVMQGNSELWSAITEKEALLERAEEEFDEVRYSELEDTILRFDGYALESRAGEILEGLNIPTANHSEPLSILSGGYKLRVLMAQVLASDPDSLLLDEPTNHLDIVSIKWLEGFLKSYQGLAVVVSHDQRFLNNVCTDIVDVDYSAVTRYKGNYNAFIVQKAEERSRREAEISKREAEINAHKAFISRFKAKATKARQANSRQKRLTKIEIEELPRSSRRHPKFSFIPRRPSGKLVLTVKDLFKQYGDNLVLDGVSFSVDRQERVAIIGPNGIGKSTFLKIAVGEVEPDLGEVNWGYETHWGYFSQDHSGQEGKGRQTVMANMWDASPMLSIGAVHGKLAAVLFSRDDVEKRLENISGGEAARLLLAKIAVKKPNVLILDEPNNHLDLEGISALSEGLKAYDGTIILVSHDRWLVQQVATRIIEITPEGVVDYPGTYEEFLQRGSVDHLDVKEAVAQSRSKKRSKKKRGAHR